MDKLEGFASQHGADFYGLPRNTEPVAIEKKSWTAPAYYDFGNEDKVVPLRAGEEIKFSMVDPPSKGEEQKSA